MKKLILIIIYILYIINLKALGPISYSRSDKENDYTSFFEYLIDRQGYSEFKNISLNFIKPDQSIEGPQVKLFGKEKLSFASDICLNIGDTIIMHPSWSDFFQKKDYSKDMLKFYFPCWESMNIMRLLYPMTGTLINMYQDKDQFKDSVVLDLGSGNGILSAYALLLGAKKVISIDKENEYKQYQKNMQANGYKPYHYTVLKSKIHKTIKNIKKKKFHVIDNKDFENKIKLLRKNKLEYKESNAIFLNREFKYEDLCEEIKRIVGKDQIKVVIGNIGNSYGNAHIEAIDILHNIHGYLSNQVSYHGSGYIISSNKDNYVYNNDDYLQPHEEISKLKQLPGFKFSPSGSLIVEDSDPPEKNKYKSLIYHSFFFKLSRPIRSKLIEPSA